MLPGNSLSGDDGMISEVMVSEVNAHTVCYLVGVCGLFYYLNILGVFFWENVNELTKVANFPYMHLSGTHCTFVFLQRLIKCHYTHSAVVDLKSKALYISAEVFSNISAVIIKRNWLVLI